MEAPDLIKCSRHEFQPLLKLNSMQYNFYQRNTKDAKVELNLDFSRLNCKLIYEYTNCINNVKESF